MELSRTIQQARELTAQLTELLETSDQETWEDILSRRAEAMELLEGAHRCATNQERETCRDELRELRTEDDRLREKSDYVLGMLALEIRESMAMPQYAGHGVGSDSLQACLDRKA